MNFIKQKIIIVAPEERHHETVMRLARVGYDHAEGFLNGGMKAWEDASKETREFDCVNSALLHDVIKVSQVNVLDVRKSTEYDIEHVEVAENFPLDSINQNLHELDENKEYYVHCKSGYRSMIAISILNNAGYNKLINVDGGIEALMQTDIAIAAIA